MLGTNAGRMSGGGLEDKARRLIHVGAGPCARPRGARNPRRSSEGGHGGPPPLFLALFVLVLLANPALAQTESRPNLARQRGDAMAQAKGSQGWWLGTAGALVVLAGAGALCLAARGKAAGAAGAKIQVLGRVHLPPKHALFLVRTGRRTLLIGTGPQGAPALLGELDDDEPEPTIESLGARIDAAKTHHRAPKAPARFDVQLGDES